MSKTPTPSVFIIANPEKRAALGAFEELRAFAESRCRLIGAELGHDARAAVKSGANRIIVIGGDGTLIGIARSLGADQIPLIGVNVGKLGFLAEFSLDELKTVFGQVLTDESLVSRRTVLHVTVTSNGQARDGGLAINDCVIQAGPPFRIIELGVSIDADQLTQVAGDGMIVCTPCGSTAHNLSAGGPIMQPDVHAIILTPLNPHSLTHRPLVVERESVIEIEAIRVNEGTTAIIDGQVSHPLAPGDRLVIRRFSHDFLLVRNPQYARWHKLKTKLHWGQAPSFD